MRVARVAFGQRAARSRGRASRAAPSEPWQLDIRECDSGGARRFRLMQWWTLALDGLVALRRLALRSCACLERLALAPDDPTGLPALATLDAFDCRMLSFESLETVFGAAPFLEVLDVRGCGIGRSESLNKALDVLCGSPSLRVAALGSMGVAPLGSAVRLDTAILLNDVGFTRISGGALVQLHVSGCCRLSDAAFAVLEPRALAGLRDADLSGCVQIGDAGVAALALAAPRLRALSVRESSATGVGLKVLVEHCERVEALDCSGARLDLDGARALLLHERTRGLLALDISHCCIEPQHGGEVARLIAAGAPGRVFVTLGLGGLLLTNADLDAVCAAHHASLQHLAIGGVSLATQRALGTLSERGAARALGLLGALERLSACALPGAVTQWALERVETSCPRLRALKLNDCDAVAPRAPPRTGLAPRVLMAVASASGPASGALVYGPLTPEQRANWEARFPYLSESFLRIP